MDLCNNIKAITTAVSAYLLEERIQPTGEDSFAPPTFMISSAPRLLSRSCQRQYNRFPFLPEPRKCHYPVTTLQLYPIRRSDRTALLFRAYAKAALSDTAQQIPFAQAFAVPLQAYLFSGTRAVGPLNEFANTICSGSAAVAVSLSMPD